MLGNRLSKELLQDNQSSAIHFVEMRKFIAKILQIEVLSIEGQREIAKQQGRFSPQPHLSQQEKQARKAKLTEIQRQVDESLGISSYTPNIVYIIQRYANRFGF